MRLIAIILSLMGAMLLVGCVGTGAAYNQMHQTGALAQGSIELTNELMNQEYKNRILGAYAENNHRLALANYQAQSRDTVTGNASETAIRKAQGLINSQAAAGDISSARATAENVSEEMLQTLKSIRESQSDMQAEINRLRAVVE